MKKISLFVIWWLRQKRIWTWWLVVWTSPVALFPIGSTLKNTERGGRLIRKTGQRFVLKNGEDVIWNEEQRGNNAIKRF